MVRTTGCDYKLLESEILGWLGLFGDIVSEITEEIYGDQNEPDCKGLPQVGNGNYLVRMRLSKDLPNFMPIYGRRVCLEYRGVKKQCNWCLGFHLRKNCRFEKMGMLEFSEKFRLYHPTVPEAFYGKLAKPVQNPVNTEQEANDNMSSNVATKVAEPKPFPEKEMGDKSKSNVQDAESKQMEVPKISLRRDSSDRNMWQNTGSMKS